MPCAHRRPVGTRRSERQRGLTVRHAAYVLSFCQIIDVFAQRVERCDRWPGAPRCPTTSCPRCRPRGSTSSPSRSSRWRSKHGPHWPPLRRRAGSSQTQVSCSTASPCWRPRRARRSRTSSRRVMPCSNTLRSGAATTPRRRGCDIEAPSSPASRRCSTDPSPPRLPPRSARPCMAGRWLFEPSPAPGSPIRRRRRSSTRRPRAAISSSTNWPRGNGSSTQMTTLTLWSAWP